MAPKERNKRIIEGNYALLKEEEKKRAVKLNESFYFFYPLSLQENKFKITPQRKSESKSTQKRQRNEARNSLKTEVVRNDFKQTNLKSSQFVINGSSLLLKDWRLFKKASPEMLWVKNSLAALNSVLDENISEYVKNGVFDSKKYLEKINTAFDEFLEAGQNYMDSRDPSSRAGKRRRRRVVDLVNNAREMKKNLNALVDAIKEGAIDFNKMTPEEIQGINSHNIINKVEAQEAITVDWQNQGNSTDVYKVQLKDGNGKSWYLKENLPFLNDDIEGFFTRRIRQLKVSKENSKAGGDPDKVEERLKKIDDTDYEKCINLLEKLQKVSNDASADKKNKVNDDLSSYFAHNFDTMFYEMQMYNMAADYPAEEGESIDDLIAKSESKPLLCEAYKMRKAVMIAEGTYVEGQKMEKMEKISASDWLKKKMGLDKDPAKHKVFLDALKDLNDTQIETLFRVTLGKEVELFGQMSDTQKQKGGDSAAINNTVTSRLAELYGFDDVIAKSKTALVKFKRRDGTEVNQLCTLSEEAEGKELIDIMKEAEKSGKKIEYSPEAIRSLMRLQAIDTLCLQKDRHGRNFKCLTDTDPKTGNIIIKTVKAYDNDMSFDPVTLEKAFEKNPERNQFLPSMNTVVKKDSALYKHIMGTYFGIDVVSKPVDIIEPNISFGRFSTDLKGDALLYGPNQLWNGKSPVRWAADVSSYFVNTEGNVVTKDISDDEKKQIIDFMKQSKDRDLKVTNDEAVNLTRYASYKFADLVGKIKDVWARKPESLKKLQEEYDKKDAEKKSAQKGDKKKTPKLSIPKREKLLETKLSDEDIVKLGGYIDELKKLSRQFDFSKAKRQMSPEPTLDIFIKSTCFMYDTVYGDTLENRMRKSKNYESIKGLMDKEGNLQIPNLLHYDKEAYLELQKSYQDLQDPNSTAIQRMKELGFSQDKIDALRQRNKEQLDNIIKAQEKAQLFYKAAGWTKKPQSEFFLSKEDYKNLNNLTELAIDPGKTYLAVDNDNYLAGQSFMMNVGGKEKLVKYTDLMSENEKSKANDYNEYIKKDEKRWKYEENDKKFKKYDDNCMGVSTVTSHDVGRYVEACKNDAIYNLSHTAAENAADLNKKIEGVLFADRLEGELDKLKKPVHIDKIKELTEDNSKFRDAFSNELKSDTGKIFMKHVNDETTKLFNDQNYRKFDNASFKKFTESCFDKSMNSIFEKMKDNKAEPEKVINSLQEMKNFAGKVGTKINIEDSLNKYIQKKPGALNEEQINKIKQGIKPAPVAKQKKQEQPNHSMH